MVYKGGIFCRMKSKFFNQNKKIMELRTIYPEKVLPKGSFGTLSEYRNHESNWQYDSFFFAYYNTGGVVTIMISAGSRPLLMTCIGASAG